MFDLLLFFYKLFGIDCVIINDGLFILLLLVVLLLILLLLNLVTFLFFYSYVYCSFSLCLYLALWVIYFCCLLIIWFSFND
jgi:hypothetical protein